MIGLHLWASVIVLTLQLLAGAVAAEVSRDVRSLPFRRPIELPDSLSVEGAWIEVWEDDALAAAVDTDFADVRVMDATGEVIPALIWESDPTIARLEPVLVEAIEWELDDRDEMSFTLELPAADQLPVGDALPAVGDSMSQAGAQRSLVIEFSCSRAMVPQPYLGSDDGATWRVLNVRYPGLPGRRRPTLDWPHLIEFDRDALRYLRCRPQSASNPPTGATFTLYRRGQQAGSEVEVVWRIAEAEFEGRRWRAILEVEGAPRALSSLMFAADPGLRTVDIEARTPSGVWTSLRTQYVDGEGVVIDPGVTRARRGVRWSPERTRELRLTVEAADPPNSPIEVASVRAVPTRITVQVPARSGALWLAYGSPYLERPEWADARGRQLLRTLISTPRVTLGSEEANPLYQPPGFGIEWLRRHPNVVTAVMFAVLALLGFLVWRWGAPRASES
jgi:hypothetical protein